jgi:transposase
LFCGEHITFVQVAKFSVPLQRGSLRTMFNISQNNKMVEVLSGPERRRRRTPQEKIAIIQQTMEPGMTVSHVARLHGINANQIFKWRKQYEEGSLTAVTAGEDVVPASKLASANKQIRELQRLLGKKTMEAEILKEAVEFGRAKKWIAHAPLLPGDDD